MVPHSLQSEPGRHRLATVAPFPGSADVLSLCYDLLPQDRHEDRYKRTGSIGVAIWRLGTMVGLRAADRALPAVVTTKVFPVVGNCIRVLLNVDAESKPCGDGSVQVELFDDAEPPVRYGSAVPISTRGIAVNVMWTWGGGHQIAHCHLPEKAQVRLRFTITGPARVYAFRAVGQVRRSYDQRLDLRKKQFRRPCVREVRYCINRGQKGGDALLVKCIWRQYFNNRTSADCQKAIAPIAPQEIMK